MQADQSSEYIRLRLSLIILAILAILICGAYRLSQDPRVHDLLHAPEPGPISTLLPSLEKPPVEAKSKPPKKTRNAPPSVVRTTPDRKDDPAATSPHVESAVEETRESSSGRNQIDNSTVGRVLLQILTAKGLAEGITLGISDESVMVAGTVDSKEKRKQILDIIDQAREARRIEAKDLVVHQEK